MPTEAGAIALLFPGQGSQHAEMGAPWATTEHWELVAVVSEASGHDVEDLLLRADAAALRRTDRAQISTFALECVMLAHARATNADAGLVAVAGHSLGEYTALVAGGVLDVVAAGRLVAARGAAMLDAAEQERGTMVAVVGAA